MSKVVKHPQKTYIGRIKNGLDFLGFQISAQGINDLAQSTKEKIMKEACVNNYTLFFEHDKDAECAKLVQTEKGIKVGEVFPLAMCNF
mgnify:CR=1 FL=1